MVTMALSHVVSEIYSAKKYRAVTVLRFHFRFGFGSVLHRKPRFWFFPVSVLREIWVKQTINCKRNNIIIEPHQLRPI